MKGGRSAAAASKAKKKKKETEEEEEEDAAIHIQAVWKGKQERRRMAEEKKLKEFQQEQAAQMALLEQHEQEAQDAGGAEPEQEQSENLEDPKEANQRDLAKKVAVDPVVDYKDEASLDYPNRQSSKGDSQSPQSFRYRIYLILEEPTSSRQAQITSIVILGTIIFSIACFMVETMPEFKNVSEDTWLIMELICTVVFTLEYVIRFLVCDVAGVSQWKFVREPMNICDFLAILPFYVQQIGQAAGAGKDMGIFRAVRLSRLLRIFKLARYSSGMRLMAEALTNSFRALSVLLFFLCIGIVLFFKLLVQCREDLVPIAKRFGADTRRDREVYSRMHEIW